jgi:hypothetical protein
MHAKKSTRLFKTKQNGWVELRKLLLQEMRLQLELSKVVCVTKTTAISDFTSL